jgi:uncharacterized protein
MASAGDKFSRLAALKPVTGSARLGRPAVLRAADEEDALAQLLGAGVGKNRYGEHLAVRNWCATPEFAEPSKVALELLSRTREEAVSRRMRAALENPEKWLFLDTETTGLAGGTGTYAFLVGIAWWDAGGLQIEQFFMRDFAEEHSLLYELAGRIAKRPVLVTFNGKSFDWPLLENRFTMTRAIPVPKLAAHLDLLHPARALWKLRLGSVRLVDLEKHVLDAARLGWRRENDVDSALIPQFYFDYLRGGPLEPLAGVVRHNQMDLRGLGALFGKMNALLTSNPESEKEFESLDLFGLSRYLQRRGDTDRARKECARALDQGLPMEHRAQARRELAHLAKRHGDHEKAAALWHELLTDAGNCVHACEQLAMYYERRAKDLAMAKKICELALQRIGKQKNKVSDPLGAARSARIEKRLQRRVDRLKRRLRGGQGASSPLLPVSDALTRAAS